MKVRVVPERPISGILPKNKWLDTEMELDLNKNEIIRCMQFGSVYNMNGELIKEVPSYVSTYTAPLVQPKPLLINADPAELSKPFVEETPVVHIPNVTVIEEEQKEEITKLFLTVSASTEDEYVYLTVQFVPNGEGFEGNLYGLLNIQGQNKPVVEFKQEDNWVKFGSKFSNFNCLKNEDKFEFRLVPKTKDQIKFRVLVKEGNKVLVQLEDTIL